MDYYHLVFSIPHTLVPLVWQNKKVLFTLLFEAAAHLAGSGCRSQTSRCGDRVSQYPAHLGTDLAAAPTHLHCVVPGRTVARPSTLDRFPCTFLLAGQSPQSGVSGEVRRRIAPCCSCRPIDLPRRVPSPGQPASFRGVFAYSVSGGLGCLRQAPIRRTRACPAISARYTHRVAISNHRLLDVSDSHVTFRWKD